MNFLGETIALFVAVSWTITALFAEVASKRIGSLPLNVIRMVFSLCLLAITLWLTMGAPYPRFADSSTWFWLMFSGLVGYVIGDYCLFRGYILIGSRFGQLFMTLSAPTAAIMGFLTLGERMGWMAILGMCVTLVGIGMSVLSKQSSAESHESSLQLKLPLKGILFATGAGLGQGVGLVLSKIGLEHYSQALTAQSLTMDYVPTDACLALPLYLTIPFAATMIRAVIGLAGFSIAQLAFTQQGFSTLKKAFCDKTSVLCALASTTFGPFVGVSLSLMATQYTSTGIAQTLMALTPVFILLPAHLIFHQKVTPREVVGAIVSVVGVCLFFV